MLSGATAMLPIPTPVQLPLPNIPAEGLYFAANPNAGVNQPTIVGQQAGAVTLILGRNNFGSTSSLDDSLQVQVATLPATADSSTLPTAVAGVHYQPILETITFPPGVAGVPVTIPILANAPNPGRVAFQVAAAVVNGPNLAVSSATATQTVVIAANPDAVGPHLVSAHMVTRGRRVTDFVLKFDRPMDPTSVQNLAAYNVQDTVYHTHGVGGLFGYMFLGSTSKPSPSVHVQSAAYNANNQTVDLHLAKTVDARDVYSLSDNSYTATLKDATGMVLNQNATSLGGSFQVHLTNKPKNTTITNGSSVTNFSGPSTIF